MIPVLLHGYDYPVPDGRGYMGGFWALPGPWLEPAFRRKGYADMTERVRVMAGLIDRFNDMIAGLPGQPGLEHVTYLDLRAHAVERDRRQALQEELGERAAPDGRGLQDRRRRVRQGPEPAVIEEPVAAADALVVAVKDKDARAAAGRFGGRASCRRAGRAC